jgi:phosphate transport system protein
LYFPGMRFIIAVLKINNELERVGDIAVNIAERGAFLSTHKQIAIPFDINKMATKVENMLTRSIDALVHMDVQLARRIRAEDDEVDAEIVRHTPEVFED